MPTGWGRGFVSAERLKADAARIRAMCKKADDKLRAEIRALSNPDIQKIMARVIRERMAASASVTRQDLTQAGIPEHRIAKNWDAALRLARKHEPKLDQMRAAPCAA